MARPQVVLTVPAQPEFLRVARMTASGLGSRLGFTIDEVDDLKLALDELCFALISKGLDDHDLRLTYEIDGVSLTICGEITTTAPHATDLNEFSEQILNALVDEHTLVHEGNRHHFMLKKRQARLAS